MTEHFGMDKKLKYLVDRANLLTGFIAYRVKQRQFLFRNRQNLEVKMPSKLSTRANLDRRVSTISFAYVQD